MSEMVEDRVTAEMAGSIFGRRTWQIARKLKLPTPAVRRALRRLEAAGKVRISERYSYANDLYWELVPEVAA